MPVADKQVLKCDEKHMPQQCQNLRRQLYAPVPRRDEAAVALGQLVHMIEAAQNSS